MEIGIIGLVVAGVLALMWFVRKAKAAPPEILEDDTPTPTPPVDVPYTECLEDWRRVLWERMQLKSNTEWTEEEWASLEFRYGDPCYREAFIRHNGLTAWNELMARMEAYKTRQAKRQEVVAQMEDDIEKAEAVIAPVVDQLTEEEARSLLATTTVEVAAEREREEWGITKAEIPSLQEYILQVNEELGGRYVGGALTPPSNWTGSVTEWSRHVQEIGITRYKGLA